jgi:hypothetical protein
VAELETGMYLAGQNALNHLKNAADTSIAIAEFHYHMSPDHLTVNL